MKSDYTLYGWELSYFSGKLRGYLRYKGIAYSEKSPTARLLLKRIPRETGASVLPVLKTPEGAWLQDTTAIIEQLERENPQPSITPTRPRQRIAAQLIEAWADEYWIPPAMHYRWSFPENYALFEQEAGKNLLPWAPKFLRKRAAKKSAGYLRGFLPHIGVTADTIKFIEQWTTQVLDILETHFTEYDYLLGGRPSVGDFGLIGPLHAHLNRDPYPKRELMDKRPNLQAWINRVHNGDAASGEWLKNDQIAETLTPLFEKIFAEFLPMIHGIVQKTEQHTAAKSLKPGDKMPRSLPPLDVPMGNNNISRAAMPYSVWMMQRVKARYSRLNKNQRASVNHWLSDYGQPPMSEWNLGPLLARRALATQLARKQVLAK